ncbi:AT-hook motif nuclear-localized protein 29-like [Vicia villosa]|uniref:AT-hook motif nuclear-localized protein 29-like n=1 Tax=Vicia villosa TaxID=3911 RepID=UPI00273C3F91|nr:AT-hook motif nuclear-localized protein 29-like [Vicia villosa]
MLEDIIAPFFLSKKLKNESSKKTPLGQATPVEVGEKRGNMVTFPNTTRTNNYEKFMMPPPQPQPPSLGEYIHIQREPRENHAIPPSKRTVGRNQGSNKKCKYAIKNEEDPDTIMKMIHIKIPAGRDVVDSLINVAIRHQSNITVLGGVGLVSNITFHNSVSQAPAFTTDQSFQMTSITGTYFIANYGRNPSEVIFERIHSSFSIFLTSNYGKVFGGVIIGKVMTAGDVLITAALSKKHEFYMVPTINERIREVEEDVI